MPDRKAELVVFGLDQDGSPHAAVYSDATIKDAGKLAKKWKLRAAEIAGDAVYAMANDLPSSTVATLQKMPPPTITREVYDVLIKCVAPEPENAKPASKATNSAWQEIEVGSICLASIDPSEGYFPAIVTAINGDKVTCRWRDFPKLPTFSCRRLALGLLAKVK